ncbi:MAG: ComEC/Rec2 family competence protein [Rickettsiaceae bacterium]
MFSYLIRKLEEEYHHLSLWCFVFFFYGSIFYFKSVDLFSHRGLFNNELIFYLVTSFILLCLIIFLRKNEKFLSSLFVTISLFFVLGVITACLRVTNASTIPLTKPDVFDIEARVSEIKPTIEGSQLILTDIVTLNKKNNTTKNRNLNKIKVSLRGKSTLNILKNDIINLSVKLFPLSAESLPGGYNFGLYLYLNGIEATGFGLKAPRIIKSPSGYFDNKLQNIRGAVYQNLIRTLGSDEGHFVAAILLGETKAINKQMTENMRNSGIAHILSVSGLHLSLVAMIFFISARFLLNCSNYLSYKINIKIASGIIAIFGSFGYLLLSGSNIAATRAFIMTLFVILAIILERSAYPLRSVMIAGMVILLFSPEYVLHPSFQLSFSAVLCLISGYEIYIRNQKILGGSTGIFASIKLYIFSNIYSSFLGSIVTAPFVIYHFYKFATYSILMNLLAVPLMSFFMMPLAILSLILMPLNASELSLKLLGFFVKVITDSTQIIVDLPVATINIGYITDFSMLIFTFGFFWICLWQTTWRYFGLVIISISLYMMYLSPKPDFIYDHRIKAIGIKNKDVIDIYSESKISSFTKEYWLNWYGVTKSNNLIQVSGLKDKLFSVDVDNGKILTMSINDKNCSNADVQIVISGKLVCNGNNKLTISYKDLINSGIALIFCQKDNCYAKFGQKSLWKVKNND